MKLRPLAQSRDTAAERYDAPQLLQQVGTLKVIPFFLKKSDRFWFVESRPAGQDVNSRSLRGHLKNGNTYYLADVKTKSKIELFDKRHIVKYLAEQTGELIDSLSINYGVQFSPDEKTVVVSYKGITYDYDYIGKTLTKQQKHPAQPVSYLIGSQSADKKWLLYAFNHNLHIKNTVDTRDIALSVDAAIDYSFSINPSDKHIGQGDPTDACWMDDSRRFYVLRKDTRKVKTLTVTNSIFSPRPLTTTYQYELPGDQDVTQYEVFIGSVESPCLRKVDIAKWPDQQVTLYKAPGNQDEFFLIRRKRNRDEMELCAINATSGKLRVVIHEESKPFINEDMFSFSLVNGGKDIFWWSDRTGWGQYYHYNLKGQLLNALTNGNWTAGKIVATDTAKKIIYLYGYGKEPGNPYFAYLYKVGFDGMNQKLLTPEYATHSISVAPDQQYFVDNYSRIDLDPKTIVRSIKGAFLLEVLKPDLKALYHYGWKPPEPFIIKAQDGVTDLYGLMWKPFNFDAAKKYPVISQVYPGPFIETVWTEFTVFDKYNNTSLAQDGFIVVCMGHRGNSPIRNAAYYKYGYGNLRDNAIEDDKYGIEQLASRFSFIDLNRVGIFGHSGGGMMTVAAMCKYPAFYKVGVASSGNHDNTIYNRTWGESYQGFDKKMETNQSLANKLQGHLLLVTGESDQNVNPANTYRMADALIKANKNFDLLVLPGQGHTYDDLYKQYFQKKLRMFFITNLTRK